MLIVLSPAALASEWVRHETIRALELNEAGQIEVMPVLYRDCDVPDELRSTSRTRGRST